MKFEMPVTVFGCAKSVVEGRSFCSVFTGQKPVGDAAQGVHGFEITKISADPVVFDQLAQQGYTAGDAPRDFTLVAMLKKAGQGKSQPYVIGVVPGRAAPAGSDNKAKSAA